MSTDGSTNSTHSSVSQGLIVFKCIQNHLPLSSFLFFHVLPISKPYIHPSIHPSFSTNIQENSQITPFFLQFSLLILLLLLLLQLFLLLLSLTRSPCSPTRFLRSSNSFSTSSRTGSKYRCAIASFAVSRSYRSPSLPFSLLPHDRTPASSPDNRTAPR